MKEFCPLCKSNEIKFILTDYKNNHYWRCNKCKFVFQNPVSEYSYNKDYWTNATDPDGNKKDQTKMRKFKIKNWYGDIVKFINKQKPGKIFDVGCGLGYLLSAVSDSWEKHGSDYSEFAISFIKKNFSNIILEELNLEKPPAQNQRGFDVVVCYHVIEHIENPDNFFKNLALMVKKDGILIIGTPNIGSFIAKRFREKFRLLGNGHLSLFNMDNLENLFIKNNFKVIKKEYPFFKTDYFTIKNLLRIIDTSKISPPFYGNIMTVYARNCQ